MLSGHRIDQMRPGQMQFFFSLLLLLLLLLSLSSSLLKLHNVCRQAFMFFSCP